jgi:hypothetical protein
MPECELCGENEEKLYKCKTCGTMFCEYCGVVEDRICLNCMVDLEYVEEDYEEEEYPETLEDLTILRPKRSTNWI